MRTLKSIATTSAIAAVAIALPASYLGSSSSSSSKSLDLQFLSPQSIFSSSTKFRLRNSFNAPLSALHMENPKTSSTHDDAILPDLLTEFMVNMKCEGCVSAVKGKLETLEGVKSVEVDLSNHVVRILGSSPLITMENALAQTGRKAKLIGQGVPEGHIMRFRSKYFMGVLILWS